MPGEEQGLFPPWGRGPRASPAERVAWGEEARRREGALPQAAKRAVRSPCRRRACCSCFSNPRKVHTQKRTASGRSLFCRGRSRGFPRPGGGAPARAQRSGSRGERRRDGERELCRRRQSERFEVRADEGRAAAASVIPGKFIRKRERPVAVLFFCLLKKPRRILCHHGRKHPDPFSLAACAWKKTRPAPRVRGLFPDSRQMMRAAG